jgi:hypothetical protein
VKRAAAPPPRPVSVPAANTPDERSVIAGDVDNAAPAAERDKAMDIAEADSPALAPEPFVREYPVAPRSTDRSKTLLEKAWLWLRGKV